MGTYALRSIPWPLVVVGGILVLVLVRVLATDPWVLWPLQGTAVGLVAGGAGWCLDEVSADVVDTAPRGLVWRTTARLPGVAVVLAAWSVAVAWNADALFAHAWQVWFQGVAAALVTVAWVTGRRAWGAATPGRSWATAVVPLVTAWALGHPGDEDLPVFPYAAPDDVWAASTLGWAAAGGVAALVLVAVLADARWWAGRGVPVTPAVRHPSGECR